MKKLILINILIFSLLSLSYTNYVYAQGYCFKQASAEYDIPVKLLRAVAYVESGFNAKAINYDNGTYDYGVMQINTVWYPVIKPYWNDLANPCYNIKVGAWILYKCKQKYGLLNKTIACYNTGEGNVKVAAKYIAKVMGAIKNE